MEKKKKNKNNNTVAVIRNDGSRSTVTIEGKLMNVEK